MAEQQVAVEVDVVAQARDLRARRDREARLVHAAEHHPEPERAAGAQIASLCDYVDLDGNLLLRQDPWPGVELVDGVQLPADAPGLGVREAVSNTR